MVQYIPLLHMVMSWLANAFEDAASDEDDGDIEQVEQPRAKRQKTGKAKARTKQNNEQSSKKRTRQRHVLNKQEKLRVAAHIAALKEEEFTVKSLSNTVKQLAPVSNSLKQFSKSLTPSQLLFLVRHLQESFV